MAIIQNVTTITPTTYTPPFYRKIVASNLYIKFVTDTKVLIVCDTTGAEYSKVEGFPNSKFADLAIDTAASDATEFNAKRTAVHAVLAAL